MALIESSVGESNDEVPLITFDFSSDKLVQMKIFIYRVMENFTGFQNISFFFKKICYYGNDILKIQTATYFFQESRNSIKFWLQLTSFYSSECHLCVRKMSNHIETCYLSVPYLCCFWSFQRFTLNKPIIRRKKTSEDIFRKSVKC